MAKKKPHKILTKEYFPDCYVELMRETKYHPNLIDKMREVDTQNFINLLEVIATYVGVVLDGTYMPGELEGLCNICYEKLRKKRSIIIH